MYIQTIWSIWRYCQVSWLISIYVSYELIFSTLISWFRTDHLCMLPLNILNEKMYVVFWFWLYLVAIFSAISIIRRMVLMVFSGVRYFILAKFQRFAEPKDLQIVLKKSVYADWFVIHLVSFNNSTNFFLNFMKNLISAK